VTVTSTGLADIPLQVQKQAIRAARIAGMKQGRQRAQQALADTAASPSRTPVPGVARTDPRPCVPTGLHRPYVEVS
jgi:hypothetical protein